MRSSLQPMEDSRIDAAAEEADRILDALLAVPSSDPAEFIAKIRVLDHEYGDDWQPRHIQALRAGLAILSAA